MVVDVEGWLWRRCEVYRFLDDEASGCVDDDRGNEDEEDEDDDEDDDPDGDVELLMLMGVRWML